MPDGGLLDGWTGKLVDIALGSLSGAVRATCPPPTRRLIAARLGDLIRAQAPDANADLVCAVRLAWVQAALVVLDHARRIEKAAPLSHTTSPTADFHHAMEGGLKEVRDAALVRAVPLPPCAIDAHVAVLFTGVAATMTPGGEEDAAAVLTAGFPATLAQLCGRDEAAVPAEIRRIADQGIEGDSRRFGELVFAAFAQLLKDPGQYPEAGRAFVIAMTDMTRRLGEATLAAMRDADAKLAALIQGVEGLAVLREGAAHLALLPEIAERAQDIRSDVAEILRIVSESASVPLNVLRTVLSDMGENAAHLDAGGVERLLRAKAIEFRELKAIELRALKERLRRLKDEDPLVAQFRISAADALSKGRVDEADAYLTQAERLDVESFEEQEASARRRRLSAAESRVDRAAVALLRTNPDAYRDAASHYAEAARIAAPADGGKAWEYELLRCSVLRRLGEEFGQNAVLMEAVVGYEDLIARAARGGQRDNWAGAQINLGNTLRILGERTGDMRSFERAARAYANALRIFDREQAPLEWAMAQNNLGTTLRTLGERSGDLDMLGRAAAAFEAALDVRTRANAPLDWAATMDNLGSVRANKGERLAAAGSLEEAVRLFEEAVGVYRAALEERTREKVPLDWALTQNNLGNALRTLGELRNDVAMLERAAEAFEEALKERTRERVPFDWAASQNNLGTALQALGMRSNDLATLRRAVSAFERALEDYTRERAPMLWAITRNNLGNALQTIGVFYDDADALRRAATAYRLSLEERTANRAPYDHVQTKHSLAVTLFNLAELEQDLATAEEALGHAIEGRAVAEQLRDLRLQQEIDGSCALIRSLIVSLRNR